MLYVHFFVQWSNPRNSCICISRVWQVFPLNSPWNRGFLSAHTKRRQISLVYKFWNLNFWDQLWIIHYNVLYLWLIIWVIKIYMHMIWSSWNRYLYKSLNIRKIQDNHNFDITKHTEVLFNWNTYACI